MGWLENNMYFSKRKLEKDHLLAKFGWNFKFYTSGHPDKKRKNLLKSARIMKSRIQDAQH